MALLAVQAFVLVVQRRKHLQSAHEQTHASLLDWVVGDANFESCPPPWLPPPLERELGSGQPSHLAKRKGVMSTVACEARLELHPVVVQNQGPLGCRYLGMHLLFQTFIQDTPSKPSPSMHLYVRLMAILPYAG